jgi:glycosyltransferase involved in cell wall biosynthesis
MKLACVIHRFGADIAGGSEAHCRVIAERLAASHDVTVLTTCAKDHVTWHNVYPAGLSRIGSLQVRRFSVARSRSLHRFRDISEVVFGGGASEAEQEEWFRENGPESPELLAFLERHGREFDRILFWSFRYYQTFFGLPLVAERAVLVPTAEEDPVIRFRVLDAFFSRPAGYLFLTPEEEALVSTQCSRPLPPSATIGVGLDPVSPGPAAALASVGVTKPYVLYLGRIDPNKGCGTLLRFFLGFAARHRGSSLASTAAEDVEGPEHERRSVASTQCQKPVTLVMAGPANMPVPDDPAVKQLGFVSEELREALLANASLLVVPSPYESLSLVLLEAWNHGVPALVNGRCSVLKGQARRADGALYYQNVDEFARGLDLLLGNPDLARQLGRQGLAYVEREYRWPHVLGKIEELLRRLGA